MIAATTASLLPGPGKGSPDIAWIGGTVGDFKPAAPGGLASDNAIRTAVVMLLFTNARCDVSELRFEHNGDRRGWIGDSFAVNRRGGEQELGSKLWLLRRSKLDASIARLAEAECVRALQPLVYQGLAKQIKATAAIAGNGDRLEIAIELIRRDGRPIFASRFDYLWKQVT